jgi:hypothetical protein
LPKWKEKRAQTRYECRLPVRVETGAETLAGDSVNFSLGGMLVEIDRRFQLGTELTLRFRLPALDVDTEVKAAVRWSNDNHHGVQFGSMRARDVWALNRLFKTAPEA